MAVELCGAETNKGPCNMPAGHSAEFHRHRDYGKRMNWSIFNTAGTILLEGTGIVPLNQGISAVRDDNDSVTIRAEFT